MSQSYVLAGKITRVMEPQTFASGNTKQDFIVTLQDTKYEDPIKMSTWSETIMSSLEEGRNVQVRFHLSGREWQPADGGEVRYFTDLVADKMVIENVIGGPGQGGQHLQMPQQETTATGQGPIPF